VNLGAAVEGLGVSFIEAQNVVTGLDADPETRSFQLELTSSNIQITRDLVLSNGCGRSCTGPLSKKKSTKNKK
jgi:hypothetical protein